MGAYTKDGEILYIHIPKCGGVSVKAFLDKKYPALEYSQKNKCAFPIGHIRMCDVERFTGIKPKNFKRIITTIRNPYEKEFSYFRFNIQNFLKRNYHSIYEATWSHVDSIYVLKNMAHCLETGHQFKFTPAMGNFAACLEDAACSTETFYINNFGGVITNNDDIYRWWLSVDGEIPDNLEIYKLEEIGTVDEFKEMPKLNKTEFPSFEIIQNFITGWSRYVLEKFKYKWAFEEFYSIGELSERSSHNRKG